MSRAFIVGINYIGTNYKLNGCINDANSLKNLLIGYYGYDAENILIMTDDTIHKPTRDNIMAGWRWLISGLSKDNFLNLDIETIPMSVDCKTLVFHYSGHGISIKDISNDEIDGNDEAICPLDFITKGIITDDEIRSLLVSNVPKNCRLVSIIDACHSGTSFDLMWTYVPKNIVLPQSTGIISSFDGMLYYNKYPPIEREIIMISGCRDDQTSTDMFIDGKSRGALTGSLVLILTDYINKSKNISSVDLIYEMLNNMRNRKLFNQIPCISFENNFNMSSPFTF